MDSRNDRKIPASASLPDGADCRGAVADRWNFLTVAVG